MCTANSTFTVEALVAKYRDYVMEHCPKSDRGTSISPNGNADEQLLATLYSIVAGSNADAQVESALSGYSQKFMEAALEREELAFLCEHFKEFVAYEFSNRDSSLYWDIPSQIYDIVKNLVQPNPGQTIFIADAGYGDIASLFPGCTVKGFTGIDNQEIWALGQIRLYAAGVMSEIVCGSLDDCNHALQREWSVDVVVYGTIWLDESKNRDLQSLYSLLKEDGKMFMCVARELLVGKEYGLELRQQLVNDKNIQEIISFENDELNDTCYDMLSDNYILLCIEKSLNERVYLKDLKKQTSKVINSDLLDPEILWPSYYDAIRPQNGVPLSKIVTALKEETLGERQIRLISQGNSQSDDRDDMPLVLSNALGDTYMEANLRDKQLNNVSESPFTAMKWIAGYTNEPSVFITGNADKLKVGYSTEIGDEGLAYYGCYCLIPKDGIDIRYVAALLFDKEVNNQFMAIFGDAWDDDFSLVLDKISVPNHNVEERLTYLAEANYKALISSQEKLRQETELHKKAMRMHKHVLTQPLSAARSMFNALNAYRERQNGNISNHEVMSQITGITVQEAFDFISKNFRDGMVKLEHIAEIDYSFEEPEWIVPDEFIENYIAKKRSEWQNFKPFHENKKEKDNPKKFLFPKDALERIFNEIIANAQAHGFTDRTRKDYLVKFSWYAAGLSLVIEIENNGVSMPKDINHDISDIMQRYSGTVKVEPSPDENFIVKYVLTFTFTDFRTHSSNC